MFAIMNAERKNSRVCKGTKNSRARSFQFVMLHVVMITVRAHGDGSHDEEHHDLIERQNELLERYDEMMDHKNEIQNTLEARLLELEQKLAQLETGPVALPIPADDDTVTPSPSYAPTEMPTEDNVTTLMNSLKSEIQQLKGCKELIQEGTFTAFKADPSQIYECTDLFSGDVRDEDPIGDAQDFVDGKKQLAAEEANAIVTDAKETAGSFLQGLPWEWQVVIYTLGPILTVILTKYVIPAAWKRMMKCCCKEEYVRQRKKKT